MESALIGAPGKLLETLCQLTRAAERDLELVPAESGSLARRLLAGRAFDLAILSMPLPDEPGIDLAARAAREHGAGVMLITPPEHVEEISRRLGDYGVFVLGRPVSPAFFHSALRLVRCSSRRARGWEEERVKLLARLEEVRLVSRAKLTLMERLGLGEAEAHRLLEKQAMDQRISKAQVAQSIVKTYEA